MNETADGASAAQGWLARLLAADGAQFETLPDCGPATIAALAALAAEALARQRSLLLVCPDDTRLADLSNALDLNLRPLCLVLPAAQHVSAITLRATLSLLKSRLSRAAADAEGPAWASQRRRLAEHETLWRQCLAWSQRGMDEEMWPAGLAALFPVRILPQALAVRLAEPSEWVILTAAARLPAELRRAWPGALRTLALGAEAAGGSLAGVDPAARQRAELEVLTQELSELELELATAHAEIADFTRRYHALIGSRMATLDDLRAELAARQAEADAADTEAGAAAAAAHERAAETRRESGRFEQFSRETSRPFAPSGDLKKLFRRLAQKIHPDRADNESDRVWRTQLMSEANRAYQAGDQAALLEVLALWEEGTELRTRRESDGDLLAAQVARLKRRIAEIEGELNRLFGSRLYELFTATNIARRAKRDLLQEMADRLDADIAVVRGQLA
ncbi:MAG: J domain-containing protein [Rhodocyclales bacterium]|nr:J domain-containing protein [Rhodocyclales bacterium]